VQRDGGALLKRPLGIGGIGGIGVGPQTFVLDHETGRRFRLVNSVHRAAPEPKRKATVWK